MKWLQLPVFILLYCTRCCETHSKDFIIRNTNYGRVKGYLNTIQDVGTIERYLGVPYAQPPVGNLRFENPVELSPWGDTAYNATVVPPACPQALSYWAYIQEHYPKFERESEDCLYLNIYVPQLKPKPRKLLEVLVHIHGGSNEVGMGAMLHGDVLAWKGEIILVTINYRLGALGFLTGNSSGFQGNYGLKDQIKALHWVQDNIHYFGGDKTRVTITGHSAGACNVGLHVISPLAKGLFRYAVMQSGSPLSFWCVVKDANFLVKRTEEFAVHKGCYPSNNTVEVKDCLKRLSYMDIIDYIYKIYRWFTPFGGVISSNYLPGDPAEFYQSGELNGEAFMTSITANEGSDGAENIFKEEDIETELGRVISYVPVSVYNEHDRHVLINLLKDLYTRNINTSNNDQNFKVAAEIISDVTFMAPAVLLADVLSSRDQDIYVYHYNHSSKNSTLPSRMGVPHGEDFFYLFGIPFVGHETFKYNAEDREISEAIIKIWSSFVKTGKPELRNGGYLKHIPNYTIRDKTYVEISGSHGNVQYTERTQMKPKKVQFWNNFMPLLDSVYYKNRKNSSNSVKLKLSLFLHLFVFIFICL